MDMNVFSDPAKIGPGIWFHIHTEAIKATTDSLKYAFEININALCDNFKCKKCQPHFRKFIDTHPFSDYKNIMDPSGRDIGYFQWTWELHNQVNKFLGKYQPSFQEAYDFFSDNDAGACFNCPSNEPILEQRSLAVPEILSLYRTSRNINPKPFRLIPKELQ